MEDTQRLKQRNKAKWVEIGVLGSKKKHLERVFETRLNLRKEIEAEINDNGEWRICVVYVYRSSSFLFSSHNFSLAFSPYLQREH